MWEIKHLIPFSGGVCSWAAAKRVVAQHGVENTVLLFADPRMEDEDLYRFVVQAAANVGWTEMHRLERLRTYQPNRQWEAPMTEPPYLMKEQMFALLEAEGIRKPRLYELGFKYNNCGGFCVKAGQAQFALLLKAMPDRYAYHERQEEEMRKYLGKDYSILTEQDGSTRRFLTLREFRERREKQLSFDVFDWGGCGCAID